VVVLNEQCSHRFAPFEIGIDSAALGRIHPDLT
jgi:hypothetical protein